MVMMQHPAEHPTFSGKVAVIMPFKNSADTIVKCAGMVLMQNIRGVEIQLICVDDGSTDGSRELLSQVPVEHTRRLVILDGPGKGPAEARNVALEYLATAHFDYVAFCDSDDQWYPWHLSRSLAALQGDCDMTYSDVECENEKGEPLKIFGIPNPEEFDPQLLRTGNYIFISTVVMKIKCIGVGMFSDYAVPMEDWEYWLRVSQSYKIKHIHNKKPAVVYMWKSTGSYYKAEDSQAAKLRIIKHMNIKDPMNLEGWLSRPEGEFLAHNAKGRRCIEIGSYKGKSANFIAPVAHSLVCIDTFKADGGGQTQMNLPTTYVDFARNTEEFTNITPLIGMSQDVHPLLKDNEFDFIFIDGMHDYDSVMADVKNYVTKLKVGSVIMFHDYFERDWPGVVRCVNELFGGPDELVDSIAKVTLSGERRAALIKRFYEPVVNEEKLPDMQWPETVDQIVLDKPLIGRVIVICPWAKGVPGRENAKNYPYWQEVVEQLHKKGAYTVQIGVAGEKIIGCHEIKFNSTNDTLKRILDQCDTFISVDTFFPHFAANFNRKGVVIFGKSDPEIFGHPHNVNLLKSREYLRPDQFRWWNDVEYSRDAFVLANQVVEAVESILR